METKFALISFNLISNKEVKKIQCPLLIIHGKNDLVCDYKNSVNNASAIGRSKCKVILRENMGHSPLQDEPAYVTSEILNFIRK